MMPQAADNEQADGDREWRRGDRGMTFVEVLVAIVLLGTAVVATLAGLRVTILGTAIERDHSRAHQWLQSASEKLVNDVTWVDCDPAQSGPSATAIQVAYRDALRGYATIVPDGWTNTQLTVSEPVEFAQVDSTYGATCIGLIDRQLVTIQIQDTDGDIVETVEVVRIP